jgi:anti-sigma regulatory factor (Ser/Thr protein kinase)
MPKVRTRGEQVRKFILENVEKRGTDLVKAAAEKFKISRQAVNKHMQKLVATGCLTISGNTKSRVYKLAPLLEWVEVFDLSNTPGEDTVWSRDIRDRLGSLPDNVMDIWQYGFTEMFNNVIDHSQGKGVTVQLSKTAASAIIVIVDNGIGIFKKIQIELGLADERHAILELSKGKLTTDPNRHSGEGIFFASRMFDEFRIMSGGVYFSHDFGEEEDWVVEHSPISGTAVLMRLQNHTARTTRQIFDQYSVGDDYGFNKTVVPVRLAQYGNDKLISRSQAKRVLARVELFKIVVFNFKDVPAIGQAFADEIFRVFPLHHRDIQLVAIHANSEVKRMIARAKAGLADGDNKLLAAEQSKHEGEEAA